MKKIAFCLLIAACTLIYLYVKDERVIINQDELLKARNNAAVQNMQADLYEIKQKITIPSEQKRSYLLDEQKIEAYKSQNGPR